MAPALLTMLQVHGLQGFFNRLMTGKARPLVMSGLGTELGLSQISSRLMKPVLRAVHHVILKPCRPGALVLEARFPPQPSLPLTKAPGTGVRFRQLVDLDDHHGVTDPSQPPPQEA